MSYSYRNGGNLIRRLFVCTAVLGWVLLLVTGTVEAQQCTGQYANDPTYAMLIPKDYAAQGNVTATITITPSISGGVASYKLTGVTVGTHATLGWKTNNANLPLSLYFAVDNATPTLWSTLSTASGSFDWIADVSWAGHTVTYILVAAANGQSTQDRITIGVVDGPIDVVAFQDGLDTNFYWQVVTTGGGSSMLTSCHECQAGTTQHCINATHTPYSTIQLTNDMSGESQLIQGVQSGNVARSNEGLSFSASLAISVRPGDTGTISIDDKIICSMDGVIFEQTLPKPKTSPTGGSWFPRVTGELAFTKVALKVPTHCTPLLDPKGNVIGLHCDVAYYCSSRSSPPDYQPTGLKTYHYTNPALVPPFWMSMSPGTALVFGPDGSPGQIAVWYFPSAELDGVLTGMSGMDPLLLDILSPAWVSDNSTQDCTKWISGISPWYMPKW